MGNIYFERLQAIRELMRQKHWDALIITGSDPHGSEYPARRWKQVYWLTGFSGEAGDVVITLDHAGLWTDTRYFIAASEVLPGTGYELHKTRVPEQVLIPQWIAQRFSDEDVASVGIAVDGCSQSYASVKELCAALEATGRSLRDELRGYIIEDVPDVLDSFWMDRPAVPQSPIISLGAELTGEDRQDKILWLRKFLIDRGLDAILLTALDEIAWVLNVRGSDVEYNPVVISYLSVGLDSVDWFVRGRGVVDEDTMDTFHELEDEGIRIHPYDDATITLPDMVHGGDRDLRLYTDPQTLNYRLWDALNWNRGAVVLGPSPVALRKAVKNEAEIQGMIDAHLEDGLAMESFLYWIDKQMETDSSITERDAADKLGEIRATIKGYRGDSFETISAYGKGAALPHYVTPADNAPRLEPHGLYLCDSGGQYIFGTTDITRTVPLGPCTREEMEDYTLVLKGHIDLAMAVFPRGTAGCQLDALARGPLWASKRNFGHGTGHGIGFFLNVHEGPQDIRQNFNQTPLLPGMITSNEPGLYREGQHGVRHESLLLCKEAGENEFGSWLCFETITLCHIDTSAIIKDLLSTEEVKWLNDYNHRVFTTLAPRLPQRIKEWLLYKTAEV